MYNIQTLNKISAAGLGQLDPAKYHVGDDVANPDAIIVRSAKMHDMELPESLLAIARAGAGTNNIPVDQCTEKGIVVFNTPGANANAVKELVIAALFLTSRKIVPGIEFANSLKGNGDQVGKLVEKGKSAFKGPEIQGKKLGVIGLGAIGILVANAAKALGMEVYGYDPYLSVDAAWNLSSTIHHAKSMDDIFTTCDYITVHVPLTDDTKDTINKDSIAKMKDGVRILNDARGGLVNTADMIEAHGSGKVAAYATDFADDDLLGVPGVLAMPHLGASTPESEDNCAHMAAFELASYLESGNIRNSVNLPNAEMTCNTAHRLTVIHKNVPNVLNKITGEFADSNINEFVNRAKGEIAYTILDTDAELSDAIVDAIKGIDGVISVRVVK
ncbi:MAG: phosphoglycerate dehydrogenase [Clostridia bacterium]|nr:phosphoglycerate dehydrogenase [Clostridia bacterium]